MSSTDYRNFIEEKILDCVEEGLENGLITVKRAQDISAYTIDYLKENMSVDQLYVSIQKLRHFAPEINDAMFAALNIYDEIKKKNLSSYLTSIKK